MLCSMPWKKSRWGKLGKLPCSAVKPSLWPGTDVGERFWAYLGLCAITDGSNETYSAQALLRRVIFWKLSTCVRVLLAEFRLLSILQDRLLFHEQNEKYSAGQIPALPLCLGCVTVLPQVQHQGTCPSSWPTARAGCGSLPLLAAGLTWAISLPFVCLI